MSPSDTVYLCFAPEPSPVEEITKRKVRGARSSDCGREALLSTRSLRTYLASEVMEGVSSLDGVEDGPVVRDDCHP